LLELALLLLERPQPSQFDNAKSCEPLLPSVEGLLAYPELANDLGDRIDRFSLPQCECDLLFCKVLLSHPKNPPFLVMTRFRNLASWMDQEMGRTSKGIKTPYSDFLHVV